MTNYKIWPKVSVIIPVHNRISHTLECLKSLSEIKYPDLEIIVVDDGSTDGTREVVSQSSFCDVYIIGDGKLWWSGSNNMGIMRAVEGGAKYVLLVNNDNKVKDPSILWPLVNYCENHHKTISASIVLIEGSERKIRSAGGFLRWKKGRIGIYGYNQVVEEIGQKPFKVELLGGQGVLIPTVLFNEIGLFDNKLFPHYHGDHDFYIRARKAGYELWVIPTSIIWDDVEATGVVKRFQAAKIMDLPKLLLSRKSVMNCRTIYNLFRRHCPLSPFWLPMSIHIVSMMIFLFWFQRFPGRRLKQHSN